MPELAQNCSWASEQQNQACQPNDHHYRDLETREDFDACVQLSGFGTVVYKCTSFQNCRGKEENTLIGKELQPGVGIQPP